MKIKIENDGQFVPPSIRDFAIDAVTNALQQITTGPDGFVVNDALHYRRQRNNKITACVMNSANFISKRFQLNLAKIPGCRGETKILDQGIDGLITSEFSGYGYRIKDKDDLIKVLHAYIDDKGFPQETVYTFFPMFYGMYVTGDGYDISHLPQRVHHLFESKHVVRQFRLGVEFETGNVASSFRAINKLFTLFQSDKIDAGVFVTSIDKTSSATRIWPVTNRNGSFQELRQRNYTSQVSLPLICIGFAPDGFNKQAPFLGRTGGLYTLQSTGSRDHTGAYDVYVGEEGEEILRPVGI